MKIIKLFLVPFILITSIGCASQEPTIPKLSIKESDLQDMRTIKIDLRKPNIPDYLVKKNSNLAKETSSPDLDLNEWTKSHYNQLLKESEARQKMQAKRILEANKDRWGR